VRTIMKKLAISLILASLNLLLIGLYCLASWRKVGCCGWGSPANIILLAAVPVVLLASLVFIVRGLIRGDHSAAGALGSGPFAPAP
jgi:hypothetical protein